MKLVFCCLALSVCWLCSPRLDAQAYIVTEEQIKRLETILTEYKTSKGAIQLPNDRELPLELIAEIARWCWETNRK